MKLHEFISKWICKNSIVRIWVPIEEGHKLIIGPCMEWEILKNENCNHLEVIGITDIVCEECSEAINIVVKMSEKRSKKEIKEMLEQLWAHQKEFMKELTGDENTKLSIVDDYMKEKYPDDEDEKN